MRSVVVGAVDLNAVAKPEFAAEAKGCEGGRRPAVAAGKTDAVHTAYLEGRSIATLARDHGVSRDAIRTAVAHLMPDGTAIQQEDAPAPEMPVALDKPGKVTDFPRPTGSASGLPRRATRRCGARPLVPLVEPSRNRLPEAGRGESRTPARWASPPRSYERPRTFRRISSRSLARSESLRKRTPLWLSTVSASLLAWPPSSPSTICTASRIAWYCSKGVRGCLMAARVASKFWSSGLACIIAKAVMRSSSVPSRNQHQDLGRLEGLLLRQAARTGNHVFQSLGARGTGAHRSTH